MANKSASTQASQRSGSRSNTAYWVAVVAVFVSILDHLYLLTEHYALKFGQANSNSLCNVSETINCAAVSASKYAELFGWPVALWGAAANAMLLLLLLWAPFVEDENRAGARINLLGLSGLIALISVVMGAISTFVIGKFCPFCMVAYVLSFISFATIYIWARHQNNAGQVKANAKPAYGFAHVKPVLIIGAVTLFLMFIANSRMTAAYGGGDALNAYMAESVSGWQSAAAQEFKSIAPLSKGASAETAKMVIVEFADFRCGHCKHAAPVLKAFVSAHPDTRLEFMAWPLDGECNTSIPNSNGASCLLARAVMCAEKAGGKGWAAHDYVFEHQDRWASVDVVRGALPEIANAVGVPAEAFATCSDSTETKDLVRSQAAIGSALNLRGTPSVYVNKKKLEGGQVLQVLSEVYKQIN